MAPKCTDDWDSWINPTTFPPNVNPTDGLIIIGAVTGNKFKGKHKVNGNEFTKLNGDCQEHPHHHIHFESEENGIIFVYDGDIHDEFANQRKFVIGTRSQHIIVDGKRKPPAGDDDVWVGVKTT